MIPAILENIFSIYVYLKYMYVYKVLARMNDHNILRICFYLMECHSLMTEAKDVIFCM